MVRFAPNVPEITPEPAPTLVMDYDSSCLPPAIPQPTPTLTPTPISTPPSELEELIEIPPMEGENDLLVDIPIENNTPLTQNSIIAGTPDPCEPNEGGWCLLQIGDVFTYSHYNPNSTELISINRTSQGIIEFTHELPPHISIPLNPSWGKVDNLQNPNHYRLAFSCTVFEAGTSYSSSICYWDSDTNSYFYYLAKPSFSSPISPDGLKIAYVPHYESNKIYIWDLGSNTHTDIVNFSGSISSLRWSDANTLYYILDESSHGIVSVGMYRVNILLSPITPEDIGLDIPNLRPYLFDVHNEKVLYWVNNINNNPTPTSLNYFPPVDNIADISPRPVYWSPRLDNQAIRISYELNSTTNQVDTCIYLSDYTTLNAGAQMGCRSMGLGYVDWASNVDLSALNTQPPQAKCLDNSQNPTPQDCIDELAQYGIIAYADGLPITLPNACANWTLNDGTTQYSQAWTLEELQQVLVGVKDTAKAFYMLENNLFASSVEAQSLTGASAGEKQIFKTVMDAVPTSEPCNGQIVDVDGFYILRVKNNFKYRNDREYCDFEGWVNGVYVKTENEACTSNSNHAIALYENFYPLGSDFIQYTFVHELGHRFDNQSGISSSNLTTRASQTITDCGPVSDNGSRGVRQVVMGYIIGSSDYHPDNWLRGGRGWGDINTLSNTPTYFQQNTLSITFPGPESRGDDGVERKENQTPEISEAMADMFLNWVYRRITDKVVVLQIDRDATTQTSTVVTDECAPPNIPDQPTLTWATVEQNGDFVWDGFRNIQIPDVHDNRLPGNARYWWMTETMDDIFRDSNWSANQ